MGGELTAGDAISGWRTAWDGSATETPGSGGGTTTDVGVGGTDGVVQVVRRSNTNGGKAMISQSFPPLPPLTEESEEEIFWMLVSVFWE